MPPAERARIFRDFPRWNQLPEERQRAREAWRERRERPGDEALPRREERPRPGAPGGPPGAPRASGPSIGLLALFHPPDVV